MLTAKSPAPVSRSANDDTSSVLGLRPAIHQSAGAANNSTLVGFENVATPSRTAAITSLRGVNSHAVRRGDRAGSATSL